MKPEKAIPITIIAGFGVFFVMMPINPLMQIYFQSILAYTALIARILWK